MKHIYNNTVVYRDFALEYNLFESKNVYIFQIAKKCHGYAEIQSYPLATTKAKALHIISALVVSRVTPCSLSDALSDE